MTKSRKFLLQDRDNIWKASVYLSIIFIYIFQCLFLYMTITGLWLKNKNSEKRKKQKEGNISHRPVIRDGRKGKWVIRGSHLQNSNSPQIACPAVRIMPTPLPWSVLMKPKRRAFAIYSLKTRTNHLPPTKPTQPCLFFSLSIFIFWILLLELERIPYSTVGSERETKERRMCSVDFQIQN